MNLLQLAVLPFSFPVAFTAMPVVFTADALWDATVVLASHRIMPELYEGLVIFNFPADLLYEANTDELGIYPLGELTQHVQVYAYSQQEAKRLISELFCRNNPGLGVKLIRLCNPSQVQ